MNAARLLEVARDAGLSFELEGDVLIVEADCDPPPELIAVLREHKAELMAALAPQRPCTAAYAQSAVMDAATVEYAAIIELGAGVPRPWAEGYAALCAMLPPTGFLPDRWNQIVDAAGVLIGRWAAKAAACGWRDLDLFGCNPDRPDARFDAMGLALLLDRCEIAGIDSEGADLLNRATGARQRYRRRPLPPSTIPLWRLVTTGQSR